MGIFGLFGTESYSAECERCHESLRVDRAEVESGEYRCPVCGRTNPVPEQVRCDYEEKRVQEETKRREREKKRRAKERERKDRKMQRALREEKQLKQIAAKRPTIGERKAAKRSGEAAARDDGGSDSDSETPDAKRHLTTKRVVLAILLLAATFAVAVTLFLGVFVIQPIGAVPDGATIVYWRHGLNLPFVASADGILEESGAGVSLLGRGVVLGKLAEPITDREMLRLPYSHTFYLWSTGGKEYGR